MKLNNKQINILADVYRRANGKANICNAYFAQAGIEGSSEITLEKIKQLKDTNPVAFTELIYVLYPERKPTTANADGTAWAGVVGSLISTAGSTLSNIYGSNGAENIIAYQEQQIAQQRKQTYLIVGVIAVIIIAMITFAMIQRGN